MFFWNSRAKKMGLAGVTCSQQGVVLTQVIQRDNTQPFLNVCDYSPCEEKSRIRSVLSSLVKQHSLEGAQAVYILQPDEYQLFLIEAPNVAEEDIKEAMRWRVKDLIDYPIEESVIDVFWMRQEIKRSKEKMIYVVAARSSLINGIADLLSLCDLNLVAIDIPENSLRNIALLMPEDAHGMASIRLSESGGLLILSQDGNINLSRRIDIDLHRWVGNKIVILPEENRQMTINERRVLDDLILEIQRSIDYASSELVESYISCLSIAPIHSQQKSELLHYLSDNLTTNVQMPDLNDLLDSTLPIDDEIQPMCVMAVGGALRHGQ